MNPLCGKNMHELGIAQDIFKIASEYAAKHNAQRITAFHIEISAAMDESEEALRFHIENLARGTLAEGATIEIARVPAHLVCLDCGNEFELSDENVVCPRCASVRVRAHSHDDFRLTSIEIE
jgi:hydrogenase nickel incorporation protein HypA/HybF